MTILPALLRRLPSPRPTPYTAETYRALPWAEKLQAACQAWALDGYGAPLTLYGLYVLKVLVYVGIWASVCTLTLPGPWQDALMSAEGFKKAVLWSMLFESLGLGCGSGPLTGRYIPPVAAPLHFLRPGTLRLPPWPGLPILGGGRRTLLHAGLYLGFLGVTLRALAAPAVSPELVLPAVVLLGLVGLTDKTIFLAARSEHYGALMVCFLFSDDWLAGAVAVQLALWLWAGVSKLNRHFPAVVCVMVSNSPWLRWQRLRQAMYRSYPDDLRPSTLARSMAGMGAAMEFAVPVLLLMGDGGAITAAGLVLMVLLHTFITANFPMAVPIEWNVMVVYSGFFLFGLHPDVGPLDVGAPLLGAFLGLSLVLVPLVGNLWPRWVSFLMSMRYYAGNWAWSIWLFRGDAAARLSRIPKASEHPKDQLGLLYDEEMVVTLMSKVPAFRAMHLHGRALQLLVPQAVDDIAAYEFADGEIIAGMVLGYNFGDGHLHDHRLLSRVQAECGFAPGELRHIQVASQPLFRPHLDWEIRDAHDGLLETGRIEVAELQALQPWPTGS